VRPLQGTKILIVEDDADSREMLTTVLTYQGANVVAAKTAFEGIEMLQEFHPHVLVSDIGLPKEDGYDLIRKIRKLPTENGGGVPAIALTGYVSLQDRQTALFSGFEEHLPKPIDAERLVDVILRLTQGDGPE
jgi:CheY-like chemotaxis protein